MAQCGVMNHCPMAGMGRYVCNPNVPNTYGQGGYGYNISTQEANAAAAGYNQQDNSTKCFYRSNPAVGSFHTGQGYWNCGNPENGGNPPAVGSTSDDRHRVWRPESYPNMTYAPRCQGYPYCTGQFRQVTGSQSCFVPQYPMGRQPFSTPVHDSQQEELQQPQQQQLQQEYMAAGPGNPQMGHPGYSDQMYQQVPQQGCQQYPMNPENLPSASDIWGQMTPLMMQQYHHWQQMQNQQQAGQQEVAAWDPDMYPGYQGPCGQICYQQGQQVDPQGRQAMASCHTGYRQWSDGQGSEDQGGPEQQGEEDEVEEERTVQSPELGSSSPWLRGRKLITPEPGDEIPETRLWHTPTEWDGDVVNISDSDSETGDGAVEPEMAGAEVPESLETVAEAPESFNTGAKAPVSFETAAEYPDRFKTRAETPDSFETEPQLMQQVIFTRVNVLITMCKASLITCQKRQPRQQRQQRQQRQPRQQRQQRHREL